MRYRKLMFMLVLTILIFGATSVCASDLNDTVITSEDTNQMGLSAGDELDVDNIKTSENDAILTQTKDNESMDGEIDSKVLGADTGTYSGLSNEIGSGGNINLTHDYYTYDSGSTIRITVDNSVIDGKGAVIDMVGSPEMRAFIVVASGVTIKNLTIKNAQCMLYGPAITFQKSGNVINCNFIGNHVNGDGGAVYFFDTGSVINCNFTKNSASTNGGAVCFGSTGSVTNCNFVDNSASTGGAIFSKEWFSTADTCIFKRNSAGNKNAVYLPPTLNVDNFTTFYGSGGKLTFDLKTNSSIPVTNGNISISVYFKGNDSWVGNYSCLSGEGWIPDLLVGSYYVIFDTEYAEFQPVNRTIKIMPNVKFYVNVTSLTINNRTVNITAKSNIPNEIVEGKLLFILPNGTEITANYAGNGTWWALHQFDDYAVYRVNASYVGLDNVTITNGTIMVNKANSTITLENIVLDYGDSKNITVTTTGATGITAKIDESEVKVDGFVISIPLLDAGNHTLTVTTIPDDDHNPVTEEIIIIVNKANVTLTVNDIVLEYGETKNVTVTAEGATGITAKIGENETKVDGFVISIPALDAGTYTLTVTAITDANHNNVTKNATITVNKIKTEITGSEITATYNINKILTITLKDGKGNALANVEVTVGLNGAKTYTTDENGQIKVSTKNLPAKTYTAKITFNGNAIYDKSTKNIKVTVNKAANPLKVKAKTVKVKFSKLKKKSQKLKVGKVVKFTKKGQGTLTYKKVKGNKKITINKKTGKVTIKKSLKKGTYKVKMKIKAKGNSNYKASAFKTITFKIKVK